jgi:hypothetical protein
MRLHGAIIVSCVLVLLLSPVQAEVTLTGPGGPIETREPVDLIVGGIANEDLLKTRVVFWPREAVRARRILLVVEEVVEDEIRRSFLPAVEFYAKNPGRYMVGVITPTPNGLEYAEVVVQVEASPGTRPDPIVTLNPEPQPTPVVKELWAVVVHGTHGPKVAQVLASRRLQSIDNFYWTPVDKDKHGSIPKNMKPWIKQVEVEQLELPFQFLIDQDAQLVWGGPMPETVDAVIKVVRQFLKE